MSQQQTPVPVPQVSQSAFSPQASSPSTPMAFPSQPNKLARPSPGPQSQPGSPYINSPYPPAGSPPATTPGAATPLGLASPSISLPPQSIGQNPNAHTTPYQTNQPNGHSPAPQSAGLPMPSNAPTPTGTTPTATTPVPLPTQLPSPATTGPQYSYATSTLAPIPQAPGPVGNMGPPTMAPSMAAKPAKDNAYDMNDMLAGTGIDLEQETEALYDDETREGYPSYDPGNRATFFGAGPMNQPATQTPSKSAEDLAAEVADKAWNEAARQLSAARSHEIQHNLLVPGLLHRRIQDMAKHHGLEVNTELKPEGRSAHMGKMQNPNDFPKPEIQVSTKTADDGKVVTTHGSFIPKDAYLVDQIALLSLATQSHLRHLLGDANRIATTRQQTTHGAVPEEWADVAMSDAPPSASGEKATKPGDETTGSPRPKSQKRSADNMSTGLLTPASSPNHIVEALLGVGKQARDAEEARLKKRQRRLEKGDDKDKGDESRAGSVAPGTPSSAAPDGEKAPTKKESKKAAKLAETSSTQVNQTVSLFAGGGKKKKYSWMMGGGSGANTPKGGGGPPGTPGGSAVRPTRGPMTRSSNNPLGKFREDSERGKNIQLRDWIYVLEDIGFDGRALQMAYDKLDTSDFGDKVAKEA